MDKYLVPQYIRDALQDSFDAPMPWIGMYIATASALCSLAMAADALMGFRSKKMWFPCKYFSLNATSLTLLAITVKLAVDLTSIMAGLNEQIVIVSSLVMMSTAMGNFMLSVASMGNNEILLNLTASSILIITIAVIICIRSIQIYKYYALVLPAFYIEGMLAVIFMLLLLILLCSSAIVVPTTKRYIEARYSEMHKIVSNERVSSCGQLTVGELRVILKKYCVMAETGSPQFVMARSVTCANSGLMCLLMALMLVEAYGRAYGFPSVTYVREKVPSKSNYKWSIDWILYIQSCGVVIGTIAPVYRWFVAVRFRSSNIGHVRSLKEELKIEKYWIQRLVEWRESSLPLPIRHKKSRKVLHDAKRLILKIFIGIQILIILCGKLIIIISAALINVGVSLFNHILKFSKVSAVWPANDMRESRIDEDLDFSQYVLLLEGEPELPKKTITNICKQVDYLIDIGKRRKSKNLFQLLQKSENFNGVIEFNNDAVKSLHFQKCPPNCWSLSVVTLTSIAFAFPNISDDSVDQLLTAVSEGLSFVKHVEKTADTNGELLSIRNAADVVWVGLELYNKWQNEDISVHPTQADRTYKHILLDLSNTAEEIVLGFKNNTKDPLMENPVNWPVKVIAASSMHQICQTLLLAHNDCIHQTEEEMFEKITIIISDILAACFTNLPRIITIKCQRKANKERVESVRQAAVLLGESFEFLELLQQRNLQNLDPEKAVYIDEWRAFMKQDVENPLISTSG